MKKLISLLLALVMVFSLAACGQSDNPGTTNSDPGTTNSENPGGGGENTGLIQGDGFSRAKIAFATNQASESFVNMQNYYNKVLGPALNIEFMFSEELNDAGALTTFIENAYAAGCQGILVDLANAIDQGAAVANDLGMFYVGISTAGAVENRNLENYISVVAPSAEGYSDSYAEAIASVVNDGQEHSVLILSGAACYGAVSFIEGTAGCLRALQDIYNLTYDEDIMALSTTSTQVDAKNDKGIKITVFPGMADLTSLVSPLLQTGEYDVLVGTTDIYASLSVAVDEVEKATGKNISFISRNTFSETIANAFNTNDSTGHPVMDAFVGTGMYEHISGIIVLRNCIDGYVDKMRDGNEVSRIPGMRPPVVTSAEVYGVLSNPDLPYCFTEIDDILGMCSVNNPDVTFADIDAYGAALTTDNLMAKYG